MENGDMKSIKSFEPTTHVTVNLIAAAFGPIGSMIAGLNDVDIDAGAGVIDDSTKCLWTKDGHRIEIWVSSDGGFGAAKSKEIDSDKPK